MSPTSTAARSPGGASSASQRAVLKAPKECATTPGHYIDVPSRPGLGLDLNLEEIARHPYRAENFLPLFRPGWEMRRTQADLG